MKINTILNKIKYNLFWLFILLNCCSLISQDKYFFDRNGIKTPESTAYYYRNEAKSNEKTTSYYVSNNTIYFEGIISFTDDQNETLNKYKGLCNWFYKNGNKKATVTYDDEGKENGAAKYYYESGKIAKEIEFSQGKLASNFYKEYNEDGSGFKIFREDFDNNNNDWELYNSDRSLAIIDGSKLLLSAKVRQGTSRYISFPIDENSYLIEAVLKSDEIKDNGKYGIIYGFKDWQNHHFFLISGTYFFIGTVYEGVTKYTAEGMFSSSIIENDYNSLKIIARGSDLNFVINGEVVYKSSHFQNFGSNIGFALSGRTKVSIDKLEIKIPLDKDKSPEGKINYEDKDVLATGSGVLISRNGFLITNHHVIADGTKIVVELYNNGSYKSYDAKIISKDIANDLAVLKITDSTFLSATSIDYKFKSSGSPELGSAAFTIGYPLALNGMGKEPKFSDGKISSKTGYNNEINTFQTTIPVQPGNSGGPVFNDQAELIGLINSKVFNADNVSYAVKINYIKALIESLPETDFKFENGEDISTLKLEEKIKRLINLVVLIKIR